MDWQLLTGTDTRGSKIWRTWIPRCRKQKTAVDLTPEGHKSLPERLQNLAACFQDRYQRLGDLQDLTICLRTDIKALDLTPDSDPRLAERFPSPWVDFSG
ncbi:hypothetical protein C8R43DRAFT_222696 [Mycena crocata]|nr:hypothetical protein C8R43DRAFT_222696 [Mycena crocata]